MLSDAPRSGKPAEFTPEQITQIVALSCESPLESRRPITQWTQRELAHEAEKRGLVKKISQVLGPVLNRIGRFPQVVSHAEPLKNKIDDARASIRFQLKKVTCLNVAVGNEGMTEDELRQNITMAINFLISLLKKGFHNIKTLTIKTTMGKPYKLY